MRALLLLLAIVALPAFAQSQRNCISVTCTVISDPFPAPPSVQPATCKLLDGATVLETTAVAGPAGAVYCRFVRNFPAGNHTLTATAIASDGQESGASSPFVFVSTLGPPPTPINLRAQ